MGRTAAYLIFLIALGSAVLAGAALMKSLGTPVASGVAVSPSAEPGTGVAVETGEGESLVWLPLFGRAAPPVPERVVTPEAPAPVFDHDLKGVIVAGDTRWAILSNGAGDLLAQEGDVVGAFRIVSIHPGGLDVEAEGARLSVGFSDARPIEVAEIAVEDVPQPAPAGNFQTPAAPRVQEVIFQGMSPEELRAVLQKAEALRRERGWGAPVAQ